jgi:hypothetical protein
MPKGKKDALGTFKKPARVQTQQHVQKQQHPVQLVGLSRLFREQDVLANIQTMCRTAEARRAHAARIADLGIKVGCKQRKPKDACKCLEEKFKERAH